MDFVEALEARMEEIASACTQCGKCFQACPMTVPAGIAEADPRHVLAGIVAAMHLGDCLDVEAMYALQFMDITAPSRSGVVDRRTASGAGSNELA